ncbi:MAG: NADAR family protein [Saprospiraceae bacterium]|nr:NADAR family protein [Saprospiraceae bacterium]
MKPKVHDSKYDLANTTARHEAGEQLKYLFFWGHQPSKDGSITQSCFSQWWEQPFEAEGLQYRTAEHWMMAGKARLFNDEEMLAKIIEAKSPAQAKKFGREVRGFDQATWEAARYGIVLQGNLHKFGQHAELKDFLLRTGNKILVEASPFDRIWGIGLAKTAPNIEDPHTWKGLNLLGFALMEVRDLLNA